MTTELKNIHLTEHDFEAWEKGILSGAQMEALFSYMSHREETLVEPPAYLAEEITERVHEPDVVIAQKAHTTSKRVQLLLYSLKVGVALAASIYMLFAMDAQMLEQMTNFMLFQ